jgi:hypothetical protein
MCAIASLNPARRLVKRRNAPMSRADRGDRDEVDSCSRDKEHVVNGKVDAFGDDEANRADPNSLDGGTTNTADGTRQNRMQRVKIRLYVADMDGCSTVEEERHNGWVNDSTVTLVGSLVG